MNHIIEVTAIYKMGHQRFSSKMSIIGRNVSVIEVVPEEVPEFADGCRSRIHVAGTGSYFVAESYEELIKQWQESLESL